MRVGPIQQCRSEQVSALIICRWQSAMLRNGKTNLHVSVPRPQRAQSQGVFALQPQSLSDLLVHLAISQSAWCPWNRIQHKNHRPQCPMYQSRQHDISVFRSFFCLPSRYCRNNFQIGIYLHLGYDSICAVATMRVPALQRIFGGIPLDLFK